MDSLAGAQRHVGTPGSERASGPKRGAGRWCMLLTIAMSSPLSPPQTVVCSVATYTARVSTKTSSAVHVMAACERSPSPQDCDEPTAAPVHGISRPSPASASLSASMREGRRRFHKQRLLSRSKKKKSLKKFWSCFALRRAILRANQPRRRWRAPCRRRRSRHRRSRRLEARW